MRRILSVSYSVLPPHLKTCLLHLSLYPEDYEIETKQLIWKWVGEGFVKKEQGKSLFEVGEDYLDELINKSLVQPLEIDNANKLYSCCVHDMVRDLITSLSNDENFLTTVGCQHLEDISSKFRRLSIHTSTIEVANQLLTMSLSHVRSLTVSSQACSLLPTISSFPVLRVLDLTGCGQVDDDYWKDICNLFHLRYLSLKGTSITKIPKDIGNLHFLQVLDIRSTKLKEELPTTFIQLTQLLLFHMLDNIACAVPRWMCSMQFLFSLSITLETLGEMDLQVLGSIPSLNDLHIQVKGPTQGRNKRLVVASGYPFISLRRFSVDSETIELRFARGVMQSLQTLQLKFGVVDETFEQFGDFMLGLENLSSLEHVHIMFYQGIVNFNYEGLLRENVQMEIDLNHNKPKLTWRMRTLEEKVKKKLIQERIRQALLVQQQAIAFIEGYTRRGL